jgi:hypothetical protein
VQLEIVAAVGCFFRCPAVYRQIAFEGINVLFFFRVGLYRRNERQSDGSLPNSHFKRQRKVHVHGPGVSMCKYPLGLGKAGAKSIGLLRAPDKPECSLLHSNWCPTNAALVYRFSSASGAGLRCFFRHGCFRRLLLFVVVFL